MFKPTPSLDALAVVRPLCEAVIVPAFKPKLTPFEFEKVIADKRLLVVPPDTLMLESVTALLCIAVVSHAGSLCDKFRPAVLSVLDPELRFPPNLAVVHAALPAFRESPAELTVHARGPAVKAVLSPTASLLARAVVK